MKKIIVTLSILMICAISLTATPSLAEKVMPQKLTSKEAFLSAWETHMKNLPTTVTFEKTDEPGVYMYETTLFPYKGRLKVLNIAISKDISYYGGYDLDVNDALKGAPEIKFLDVNTNCSKEKQCCDSLYSLYPYSYDIWKDDSFLFFDEQSGKWLDRHEWRTMQNASAAKRPSCSSKKSKSEYYLKQFSLNVLPYLLLAIFLIFIIRRAQKTQKAQVEKYDLTMERQKESVEDQKRGLAMAEESLKIQKEQLEILKSLMEKK